jgi:VIT1/CCC1 family predicted Fe2+/Mn2+ transporter
VSVSSQRDAERAMLALERRELAGSPQAEVAELVRIYESKGLPPDLSRYVAEQLTARDPLRAHAEAELGIDPEQLARPGHAAVASFLSFMAGAVLPLLAITLVPVTARVPVRVFAVLAAWRRRAWRAPRSAARRAAPRCCAT